MLCFSRSVQPTEGYFYATRRDNPDVRTPIEIFERGVRGQSSEDNAKKPGKSNVQTIEFAIVPQNHDGLRIEFAVRFLPCSVRPNTCGDPDVASAYRRLTQGYRAAGGFSVLAGLYVWNLANARFAWRNRFHSDAMTVTLTFPGHTLVFDPFRLSLESPPTWEEMVAAIVQGDSDDLEALIEGVVDGLSNTKNTSFRVAVCWDAESEPGQEVFPSQDYPPHALREARQDENSKEYGKPLKILAKLPVFYNGREMMQASLHAVKTGAAIRHIDIWHGDASHPAAIAVNAYGGVQETGAVLRNMDSAKSFYELRADAAALISGVEAAEISENIDDGAHFVLANMVRGGVYGKSSKKTKEEAKS